MTARGRLDGVSKRPPPGRDLARAVAVLVAALLQAVAGVVGGSGVWGEPVGEVADDYPTPLLPGSAAFSIWLLIYVSMLALAVRQLLSSQPGRLVHRRTGWWLAAAGVLNAAWVVVFTQQWIALSQVVLVALLICLAVPFARLAALPAQGLADRLLLHGPVALYLGWMSVATVLGAATTGAALGIDSSGGLGEVLAIVALLGTAGIVLWVLSRATATLPFAAAVGWALVWVAVATWSAPVAGTALVAAVIVVAGAFVRVITAVRPARAAWG